MRLLLLQFGYHHRTKVLGWLLPNFKGAFILNEGITMCLYFN